MKKAYNLLVSVLTILNLDGLGQHVGKGILSAEKVFIQTDRAEYVAGETVWLRAYLADAARHTPAVVSQAVHLNLFGPTGRVVDSQTLHLAHGSASGQFRLPDTLSRGTYHLVAHTQWMRNFDEAFFFRKPLTVWGRNAQPQPTAALAPGQPDLQFFPEGGHLVSGLLSRVALKATDASGRGLPVRGRILDDLGQPVTEFAAVHRGLGLLTLTPQPQRRYHALLEHGGQTLRYELPTPLSEGQVLTVDNLRSKAGIVVQVTGSQPKAGDKLYLFAHLRGQQVFEATLDGGKATSNLLVPVEALPGEGIVHVTLFDARHRPLAERLVYVGWGQQQMRMQAEANRPAYGPRQAVTLRVRTTDVAGQPVPARLSLAVTDGGQVSAPEAGDRSLPSYLLLESDVRGHVEGPGYYFDSTNVQARLHLDYLLMSQGWRRFTWQQVLTEAPAAPKFLPERGITLRGQAFRNKKPAGKTELKVTLKTGSGLAQAEVTTDAEGRFVLGDLPLTDSTTVVVDSRDNRYVRVEWEPRFVPGLPPTPAGGSAGAYNISLLEKTAVMRQQAGEIGLVDGTTLPGVEVRARKLDPLSNDSRRIMYAGEPDVSLSVDEKNSAPMPNIFMFMQGRVAGVNVTPTSDPTVFNVSIRGGGALLLLDGNEIDFKTANQLNPRDIETIDVLKDIGKVGIYGARASGGGVINFITKRGNSPGAIPTRKDPQSTTVAGYATAREFYSPRYETTGADKPDFRPTLYWNPDVQTDAEGRATVTFYTSDAVGTLHVVAEGLTDDGKAGHTQTQIQVTPKPQ